MILPKPWCSGMELTRFAFWSNSVPSAIWQMIWAKAALSKQYGKSAGCWKKEKRIIVNLSLPMLEKWFRHSRMFSQMGEIQKI